MWSLAVPYAYTLTAMPAAEAVRSARESAGLSVRGLAEVAGVSPSTIHRIERGHLAPTVDMLERILAATGLRLELATRPDPQSVAGLGRSIAADLRSSPEDRTTPVRRAAEFAARFDRSDQPTRMAMLAVRPAPTSDRRWDSFLAALAEWLGVRGGVPTPSWVHEHDRYLDRSWWVTPMRSLEAWEFAGSPASFQRHGVYLHRDSLTNV
jgi:transcriptional regulator with XRE-family HTH domain